MAAMLHLLTYEARMHAQVTGLSIDVVATHDGSIDPSLNGFTTYRVYANTSTSLDFVSAVYGDDNSPLSINSTGTIFQAPLPANVDFGHEVDPNLYGAYPAHEYDSWMTIGAESNSVSFNVNGFYGGALLSFNDGLGFSFDDAFGDVWFSIFPCTSTPDLALCAQGDPRFGGDDNQILLAQITTNGALSGILNVQVFMEGNQGLVQEAEGLTFSSNASEVFGCTQEGAINYDENATADDESCIFPCSLSLELDNVDNVECDANNAGLIQVSSEGAQGADYFFLDALPQGSFDNPTGNGGQNFGNFGQLTSGTYTLFVIDNAGCVDSMVVEVPSWIYDCDGTCLIGVDAVGVCGGTCESDADSDNVCDDVDDCIGVYDECGVCNGDGSCSEPCMSSNPCWSDDVSDCSTWTFGNGSGETGQPWAGIGLDFECSTVGSSGFYNQWAGGDADGSAAPGMNSTTGENGFLLVDSDEFGSDVQYSASWVENSWVQTAQPIDLLGHQYVKMTFETRYRCWDNGASDGNEKCFVEFSRDGVTWPMLTSNYTSDWESEGMVNYSGELVQCRYEVFPDSETGFQTDDPSFVELNVSEAAGNQAEVWVRFRWVGTWGYSWEIDDIAIYDIPSNDLRLGDYVSITNILETGYHENGTWALSQIPQDLAAGIQGYNAGSAAQTNVEISLDVNGATVTSMVGDLAPENSATVSIPYTVSDVGEYTLNYAVSADAADDDPSNNSTSQSFVVTEHIYGRDNGTIQSAWPPTDNAFADYMAMPLYDIHNDALIYGIDVALMDGAEVGTEVRALLFDMGAQGDVPSEQYLGVVLESNVVALSATATNILGDDEVAWVTLLFDEPYPATAGQSLGAAFESFGGSNVQVAQAQEVPDGTAWYYGPFGGSGAYDWYYTSSVPMVRLNLDPDAVPSGVGVAGCTDPEACNYEFWATISTETCVYADGPCEACNGDSVYFWDADGDGVCDYDEIAGCTDETACNFDPLATEPAPGNACEYPDNFVDCNGNCLNDTDGDGVCDEFEVYGCTIESACNFELSATELDITVCVYPGDLCDDGDDDTTQDQFDENCDCVGQGPQGGCTNPYACNYDEDADFSDGSCLFQGDPCDDGNPATTGDIYTDACVCMGEATLSGCINPIACNFDENAVESDGSCLFPGDPCDDGDEMTMGDTYTDECGCEGTTTEVAEADELMRLYPNPACGFAVVELASTDVSTVVVFDQWGRQVKSAQVVGTERLDLGSLAAGIYQVVARQGRAIVMRRPLVVLEGC